MAPGNRAPPRDRGEVVVLGGGLAGIAATAALVDAGVDVLLLEAGDAPGGKLRATSGGVPRGPLVWEARRASVTRLVERLGLAEDVMPASPSSSARYVVRDGALCALQPDLRSLWSTRALSWRDRLMLATEPLRMALGARRGGRADGDDESVAAFFRRHFGAAVADRLVAAMVGGIWAGDPELLSLHSCFPDVAALAQTHGSVVKGLLQRQRALAAAARVTRALPPSASSLSPSSEASLPPRGSLTLRGGLASIGAAAAATLPVRTGATVTAVAVGAGQGVRLTLQDGSVVQARAVVVATEAPAAARLLAPVDAALSSSLAGIAYAPLAVVHWREDSPGSARLPAGFGWLAPPRERTFSLGTLFVTDLVGGADKDDGRRRFAGFVGGVLAPQRAALDEFALARGLTDELRALTGGAFGAVLHVERQPHAVAQPTLGHRERVARLRALTADGALVLAGSYLGAGAMRCAVEAGVEAAAAVVARLPALPPSAWSTRSSPLSTAPAVDAVEAVVAPPSSWLPPAGAPSSLDVVPLVVVGASYRAVSTELRARLAACEPSTAPSSTASMASSLPPSASSPAAALLSAGYADGVVVLATCSRVEWIVSSSRPQWAAEILKSTLLTRVPGARLHVRTGGAAAHYLLRVGMGLDSVAEGEPAVGRQLVLAFERAHRDGTADRVLRQCWRATQQLLGERRRRGVVRHGLGVQTLVVEALQHRGVARDAPVGVLGRGEIGRAVAGALSAAGHTAVTLYGRQDAAAFAAFARAGRAVVVCTGAPAAHAVLPARDDGAVVVDVGVPAQVASAPGWTSVGLEDLLAQPRRLLDDGSRAWLVEQVATFARRLSHDLAAPAPAGTLSAIDEERRVFLRETLPPLLEKLPAPSAHEVRRACAAFAHSLIERVRAESPP